MTRVNTFRVSFCNLLTVHFPLFTASEHAAGLPAEARRRHGGLFDRGQGVFFQHSHTGRE